MLRPFESDVNTRQYMGMLHKVYWYEETYGNIPALLMCVIVRKEWHALWLNLCSLPTMLYLELGARTWLATGKLLSILHHSILKIE